MIFSDGGQQGELISQSYNCARIFIQSAITGVRKYLLDR